MRALKLFHLRGRSPRMSAFSLAISRGAKKIKAQHSMKRVAIFRHKHLGK